MKWSWVRGLVPEIMNCGVKKVKLTPVKSKKVQKMKHKQFRKLF